MISYKHGWRELGHVFVKGSNAPVHLASEERRWRARDLTHQAGDIQRVIEILGNEVPLMGQWG